MIPKSGSRFSGRIMRKTAHDPEKWDRFSGKIMRKTKHDPEKWYPVFGQDHAQDKA